jgi:hypothetical protein
LFEAIKAGLFLPNLKQKSNIFKNMKKTGLFFLLLFFMISLQGQTILSINPDSAQVGQSGVNCVIMGQLTHFSSGSVHVWLKNGNDSIAAVSNNPITNTVLYANFNIPQFANPGTYNLYVRNNTDGILFKANAFRIVSASSTPILISIYPDVSYTGQTVSVTVTAQNTHFSQSSGTGNQLWLLKGTEKINGTNINPVSNNMLIGQFVIPGTASVGKYDVYVQNATDGTLSLSEAFTLITQSGNPGIQGVIPSSGKQGSTINMTVMASQTHFTSGPNTVSLSRGQTLISPINVVSTNDTTLAVSIQIPAAAPLGMYRINVRNDKDGQLSMNNAFEVITNTTQPLLMGVTPNKGFQGKKLSITISGSNTQFTQGSITDIQFRRAGSSLFAVTQSVPNDSTLQAELTIPGDASLGQYNLILSTSNHGNLNKTRAFEVLENPNPVKLLSITPTQAKQGEKLSVSISGQNTSFDQGTATANQVWFEQGTTTFYADMSTAQSSTQLNADIQVPQDQPTGLYTLVVYNPADGELRLQDAFTVNINTEKPKIINIDPNYSSAGQTLIVKITGEHTHFSQGTSTRVVFRQGSSSIWANSTQNTSDTKVLAQMVIPLEAEGYYDVEVINDLDGTLIQESGFRVLDISQPYIVSMDPDNVDQGNSITVTITGANTHFKDAGSNKIELKQATSTISPAQTFVVGNTKIKAQFQIPEKATPGFYTLNIINGLDGIVSLENGFKVNEVIVGIEDPENNIAMSIYPNPARSYLYMDMTLRKASKLNISVFNLFGQEIKTMESPENDRCQLDMDIRDLPEGLYIIRVSDGHDILSKKFIKE